MVVNTVTKFEIVLLLSFSLMLQIIHSTKLRTIFWNLNIQMQPCDTGFHLKFILISNRLQTRRFKIEIKSFNHMTIL